MKKSRYTEEQIAFALKQAETGTPVAEVIRPMGVSEQTFYRWKKVYGGWASASGAVASRSGSTAHRCATCRTSRTRRRCGCASTIWRQHGCAMAISGSTSCYAGRAGW